MKKGLVFGALAIVFLLATCYFDRRQQAIYLGDAAGYHAHLPSILLFGDVGDYSKTIDAWKKNYAPIAASSAADLGYQKSPTGQFYIKYPLGVPLFQSPFFLGATLFCRLSGRFAADGWSEPYIWATIFSANFYGLLGLWLLFLGLKRLFPSENLRYLTIVAVGLGTNLFYQLTYNPGMSHQYAFFLFAALLWLIERRAGVFSTLDFMKMGLVCGLLFLTRHTDGLCILLPAFWGLEKLSDLPKRILSWWQNRTGWFVFGAAFLLPAFLQSAYWFKTAGRFWFDGYQNEEFHFRNPRILDGIFGYLNGWLVYTPIMFLAVLGLFWLKKWAKAWFWPTVGLLALHVWIIFSWWCWQYINGFGCRAMIDVYPVLAISMAAFFAAFWQKKVARVVLLVLVLAASGLNFFQNWQQSTGILWTEAANKAFFWAMFGQTQSNRAALIGFDSNVRQPDETTLQKTRELFFLDAETPENEPNFSEKHHFSGQKSARCAASEFTLTAVVDLQKAGLERSKKQWIRASVQGFMPTDEPFCWNRDKMARLVVEATKNGDERPHFSRSIRIASKIKNQDWSIWNNGQAGEWGEAAFYFQLPSHLKKGSVLKCYIWNPDRQNLYADDLRLELFEKK